MNVRVLREAAVESLRTIASIRRRSIFWVLAAAAAGYSFGYQDAYRGPESWGWRVGALIDRLTPESIRAERKQNAESIRQHVQNSLNLP